MDSPKDGAAPDPREIAHLGGMARARRMTSEQLSDAGRAAAIARWSDGANRKILKAICGSEDRPLRLGSVTIPAYVLEDETRVLALRGVMGALGRHPSGSGGAPRIAQMIERIAVGGVPTNDLAARLRNPIRFTAPHGGPPGHGYDATILADICEVVLKARELGRLPQSYRALAKQCEVLVRGWARLGIIALVDDVTGYTAIRSRDNLAKILEAFVAKEIQPWVSTFPPDFYRELFRLWMIPFSGTLKRPQYIGTLTNNIVYSRLAPAVLETLQAKNPTNEKGHRSRKHHQHLTRGVGHPKLLEHLSAATALMRISDTKEAFLAHLEKALPKWKPLPLFDEATATLLALTSAESSEPAPPASQAGSGGKP